MYLSAELDLASPPLPLADPGPSVLRERRAERVACDLLVRYAWKGLRATVMLKDLTRFGARIEGIAALRQGDGLTLLLPALPATDATVAWTAGSTAGLLFERPLDHAEFAALLRDFACGRADFAPALPERQRRAA